MARLSLGEAKMQIEQLKKEVENLKGQTSWRASALSAAETELNELHMLLDLLPNSPPRKITVNNETFERDCRLTHRLASWLMRYGK